MRWWILCDQCLRVPVFCFNLEIFYHIGVNCSFSFTASGKYTARGLFQDISEGKCQRNLNVRNLNVSCIAHFLVREKCIMLSKALSVSTVKIWWNKEVKENHSTDIFVHIRGRSTGYISYLSYSRRSYIVHPRWSSRSELALLRRKSWWHTRRRSSARLNPRTKYKSPFLFGTS
jgi:hypothetical protein